MRRALLVVAAAALLGVALVTPVAADQTYHTERLPVMLTDEGQAAGYPTLTFGQLINAHANGPTVYANENFVIHGARPLTTFMVERIFYWSDCTGEYAFSGYDPVFVTDKLGNAHVLSRVVPSDLISPPFNFHNSDWGVAFALVDSDGVYAYATRCTNVHLD